ncbi:MAG: WS/DGAT/MGAT family O-acyltransferase [Burkholderiales bacterium]
MLNHLSALDALFLYLETPETPMHVGSLILMEKPKSVKGSFYQYIRAHIEARLHLAPLFTRKLAFMPFDLANPIWVAQTQDALDLNWHIQSLTLPKPGTRAQLDAMVAHLHEGMLDRDRPLWQFTVIEGLQSGEVAFYAKIHHAGLDGQGGVALAQATLDLEPKLPKLTKTKRAATTDPSLSPSAAKMISAALRTSVAQYGKILRAVPGAVKSVGVYGLNAGVSALSSSQARKMGAPSEQLAGVANMAEMAASVATLKPTDTPLQAAKKLLPKGIKLGPRTPLNVAITAKRGFSTARIPLDETKALARHFDVKLNEIVLATCAGALRRYFASNKAALTEAMVGAVPASLRAPGDTSQNNQVTMMLINLATNIADPVKRIEAIKQSSQSAKMMTGAMKGMMSTATSDLPTLGIPWLMSIITPLYKSAVSSNRIPVVANVVISNVPGPPVPLYMAGARMTAYYPVSIVTHGLALNITIHSYAGNLDYGLIAAKKEVPKLEQFGEHLLAAHAELLALAQQQTAATPRTPAAAKTVAKPKAGKTKTVARKSSAKPDAKPSTKKTTKRVKR